MNRENIKESAKETNQTNYGRYQKFDPIHWSQARVSLLRLHKMLMLLQLLCIFCYNIQRSKRKKARTETYKHNLHVCHRNVFEMLDINSSFLICFRASSPVTTSTTCLNHKFNKEQIAEARHTYILPIHDNHSIKCRLLYCKLTQETLKAVLIKRKAIKYIQFSRIAKVGLKANHNKRGTLRITSIVYSQGECAPHTSPHYLLQGLSHHHFLDLSWEICLTYWHVTSLTCEPLRW